MIWRAALLILTVVVCGGGTARAQTGPDSLSRKAVVELIGLSPDAFVAQWNARRAIAESATQSESERRVIVWRWAAGMVDYPYFHWRETGESVPDTWAPRKAAIAAVRFDEPSALEFPAYRDFLEAWLHDGAGLALRADPALRKGDNVWLRARFKLLAQIPDNRIAVLTMARVLEAHIDDNGARDIAPEIEALTARGAAPDVIAKFRSALADEKASFQGHEARVYKTANGVDLYLHLFRPEAATASTPVAVWFHGGSWESGHWSHCPVLCTRLKALGFTVVHVEYRTAQRFDTTPLDMLKDGTDSLNWLKKHASALKLDTAHMVVAGFSSGASLAAQLSIDAKNRLSGAVLASGCYDLTEESWYVRTVSPNADVKALSPVYAINRSSPPMLILHARNDELCSYAAAEALAEHSVAFGRASRLIDFNDGGHFFVFTSPQARERMKMETGVFVRNLGLTQKP